MRIAYFSPLNPMKSGISDYSEELLPFLSEFFEIDIFVDQYKPNSNEIVSKFNIYYIREFDSMSSKYDEIIYHIGNNAQYHENIYKTALKYPGIVVLHDFALHHLIAQLTVGRNDWESYVEEMKYNYDEEGERFAIESWQGKRRVMWETDQTLNYPANKRIINHAKAVIVHSKFIEEKVKQIKPDCFVHYVPLFTEEIQNVSDDEITILREKYGIKQNAIVFSSFGFISRAKRIDVVINAVKELVKSHNNIQYLLVGEEEKNVYEMSSYIRELGLEQNVKYIGYVDLNQFKEYIKLSDVCINLRYPTQGESSASLLRILGYGKPALVTNIGSFMELPDSFCIKTSIQTEKEDILRHLTSLLEKPKTIMEMGRKAVKYIQENCRVDLTARGYSEFIINLNSKSDLVLEPRFYYKNINILADRIEQLGIQSDDRYIKHVAGKFGDLLPK